MKTFQLTLEGYDGSTDKTDHLIKWVNAPSRELLDQWIANQPFKVQSVDENLWDYTLEKIEGVDYTIEPAKLYFMKQESEGRVVDGMYQMSHITDESDPIETEFDTVNDLKEFCEKCFGDCKEFIYEEINDELKPVGWKFVKDWILQDQDIVTNITVLEQCENGHKDELFMIDGIKQILLGVKVMVI